MASGRVLNNPTSLVDLHIDFMNKVVNKFEEYRTAGVAGKEELNYVIKCVKLFYLGPPNGVGEPTQGPDKVLREYRVAIEKIKLR